jgi:hypothetical protein
MSRAPDGRGTRHNGGFRTHRLPFRVSEADDATGPSTHRAHRPGGGRRPDMTHSILPAILLSALAPAVGLAANCGATVGERCDEGKPCQRRVTCCERVKVCIPVERVRYRLVKDVCQVPKTRTKCVSDPCDPCAPSRLVTWTEYHRKVNYRWERYTVLDYKTRYIKRCTEQVEQLDREVPEKTVASSE